MKDNKKKVPADITPMEDSALENAVGGDGLPHAKLEEKPWFAIGSESPEDPKYPSPKIGWGNEKLKLKPFDSDDGTTPSVIK